MPSTATITTFYNFSPNTKARATQVNTNFDIFRGHLIPVDPNTAASANNTYDLGSSEYRWRRLYLPTDIGTTTADIGQMALSPITTGSFQTLTSTAIVGLTITITTAGRPVEIGCMGHNGQTSNSAQIGGGVVNGVLTIMRGGSTVTTFLINGSYPPGVIHHFDFPAAGTYSYYLMGHAPSTATGYALTSSRFYAREI